MTNEQIEKITEMVDRHVQEPIANLSCEVFDEGLGREGFFAAMGVVIEHVLLAEMAAIGIPPDIGILNKMKVTVCEAMDECVGEAISRGLEFN